MLVVLLFIACNVAALLLNVFEAHLGELLGPHINYVVDASNFLVVLNSSCNFLIYVTFSLAFRSTLRQHILKTDAKSTSQTNTKSSETCRGRIGTSKTTATIRTKNLCRCTYEKCSESNSSSSSHTYRKSSKSNSTADAVGNENWSNHQDYRYFQLLSYNHRGYRYPEHIKQVPTKETNSHVPALEILI